MRDQNADKTHVEGTVKAGDPCDETEITDKIVKAVKHAVCDSGKRFLKVAFVGLDRKSVRKFRKALSDNGFLTGFLKGLEDAKEWLLAK